MVGFGSYSEKVLEHYQNPRSVGEIEDADGVGEVGNTTCGAAIATSSIVTELVKGKTIEEALQVTNRDVAEALDGRQPIKTITLSHNTAYTAADEDKMNQAMINDLRKIAKSFRY